MANRTVVVASDYKEGDIVGPYRKATSSDTMVDGSGIGVSPTSLTYVTKTSDYPVTTSDYIVLVDATSNNITITLPSAVGLSGRMYNVKRIDGISGHSVTVTSSVYIDNQTSGIALDTYASINVISNNSKWWIV